MKSLLVLLAIYATQAQTVKDPELAAELARRVQVDQEARIRITEASKKGDSGNTLAIAEELEKIDSDNTAWLSKVVDEKGWPGKTLVGEKGASNAWLLVQHADLNPKFQRRCLDLMAPLVKSGEVEKKSFAYLTDRVLLAEGKKQLYGTQMVSDGKGSYIPRPTEDPKNLDKRRKEMGLSTIKEYIEVMKKAYG